MKTAPILALLIAAAPALAQDLPPGIAAARLAEGWIEPDGTRISALVVDLEPGWKTYWRSPGDGGVPPMLDWTASQNLGPVSIDWPAPQVFQTEGLTTLGYHDRMVLPLRMTVADAGQPVAARLRADLGVCRDICVPVALDLSADWPATTEDGADAALIRAALDARPAPGPAPSLCTLTPIKDGMTLAARFDPAPAGVAQAAVESDQAGIWAAPATVRVEGTAVTVTADLVPPESRPFEADPDALRFTLLSDGAAVEAQGCAATQVEPASPAAN